MMIDDDGSIVTALMTMMTVNIKTIQALSERSLTQYSPHLSVFSPSRHRCTGWRMTFLSPPLLLSPWGRLSLSKVGNSQLNLKLHNNIVAPHQKLQGRNTDPNFTQCKLLFQLHYKLFCQWHLVKLITCVSSYTCTTQTATLVFIWCLISGHLVNLSPVFTILWSPQTPERSSVAARCMAL